MAVARHERQDEPFEETASLDDLRRIAGGGNITLAPVRKKRRKLTPEEKAKADEEAFLSTAGALAGEIDYDEFMRRVREGRSSRRPSVVFDKPLE